MIEPDKMTAYELADELDWLANEYKHIKELRQQADKIKELEKDLEACEYFLKNHPLKQDEQYFCHRCGKRLGDGIHTCTPPNEITK